MRELLVPLTDSRRAHTIEVSRKVEHAAHQVPESLRDEVTTAAYLHDVGYGYPVSGFHQLDGAERLRTCGYSPIVCYLVAFHSASTVEA